MMNHLRLFGGAALDGSDGPVTGRASQRHRIALLALLATTRRLYRSRDQLITLLWPENDTERGRKLLSDSIYRLNQALGGDVLAAVGDDLRLNRTRLACDVASFESAIEAQDWKMAAELYRGDFLDGFYIPASPEFDQWIDSERAHYQRTALKAIETLATQACEAGALTECVEWWQRLSELVPDDSRVSMELMRALEAVGNRAGALRHAQVHAKVLRETIGVEPDKAVLQLSTQISRRDTSALAVDATVAVLPFGSHGEQEGQTYFADGISEELIFLLSRTSGLRVASRTSSFAYRDLPIDVRELARRLSVAWVVEGSVRRTGNSLRVSAQLIDGSNGFQVWSDSFDRTANDIVAIQTEIVDAIAQHVRPSSAPLSTANNSASPTRDDAETFDLYLQARYQCNRRTEESLHHAVALYERVLLRDSSHARAYAGLADTHAVMAFYDYVPPHVAYPRADAAARRAIQLDSTLAAPYATIAYIDTYYRWDWASAEARFQRAIELNPLYATSYQWYANLLTARGRFQEAETAMRRAATLDPLSMLGPTGVAWVMMYANQTDRAIQQLYGALQLDPGYCLSHYWMGVALLRSGQPNLAVPYLERAVEMNASSAHRNSHCLSLLARAYASAGDVERATLLLNQLLECEASGRYVPSFQIGEVYLALGNAQLALDRFERAFVERAQSLAYLRVDSQLWPLMREPRFRSLVERVERGEQEHFALQAS